MSFLPKIFFLQVKEMLWFKANKVEQRLEFSTREEAGTAVAACSDTGGKGEKDGRVLLLSPQIPFSLTSFQ